MRSFRSFPIKLPSGERYWTVLDRGYRPVVEADEWLLHVRLGQDRAESTTQAYATSLALLFEWCAAIGRDWRAAPGDLGRFVFWLRYYDPDGEPGAPQRIVRNAGRINGVMAAVREFFRHAVAVGAADARVLDALFDVVDDIDLPSEVCGERAAGLRSRPRHRLSEPERVVDTANDEEVLGLVRACRNARTGSSCWRCGGSVIGVAS